MLPPLAKLGGITVSASSSIITLVPFTVEELL